MKLFIIQNPRVITGHMQDNLSTKTVKENNELEITEKNRNSWTYIDKVRKGGKEEQPKYVQIYIQWMQQSY